MKLPLNRFLITLCLIFCALSLHAQTTVNFTSPYTEIGTDSTGSVLDAGYTFAVGSFESFTPSTSNMTDWLINFTALGSVNWDETFTNYSGSADLANNNAPFTNGTQGYVWGYNTQTIAPGTEWILLTNTNWTYPISGSTPTVNWDASDVGTITILGFLAGSLGANPYLQTANVTAVPEPSTYAFMAGLAMLGFVWFRRRRAAHS